MGFRYNQFTDQRLYQAGMLSTQGNNFLSNQNLLGFSVDNQTVNNLNNTNLKANPINVYLVSKSKVDVYKDGYLIYSTMLPSGKQDLDTSSFPSGAYTVKIVITSDIGTVTQKTAFVTKLNSYQGEKVGYYFFTGLLQKNSGLEGELVDDCLLYTSPSPRD